MLFPKVKVGILWEKENFPIKDFVWTGQHLIIETERHIRLIG
jgi:hypothetical protein